MQVLCVVLVLIGIKGRGVRDGREDEVGKRSSFSKYHF